MYVSSKTKHTQKKKNEQDEKNSVLKNKSVLAHPEKGSSLVENQSSDFKQEKFRQDQIWSFPLVVFDIHHYFETNRLFENRSHSIVSTKKATIFPFRARDESDRERGRERGRLDSVSMS